LAEAVKALSRAVRAQLSRALVLLRRLLD